MSHVDSGRIFAALALDLFLTVSDASKRVRPVGQHGSIGTGGGLMASLQRTDSSETAKKDSERNSFIIVF
jgi:hypothetical protein